MDHKTISEWLDPFTFALSLKQKAGILTMLGIGGIMIYNRSRLANKLYYGLKSFGDSLAKVPTDVGRLTQTITKMTNKLEELVSTIPDTQECATKIAQWLMTNLPGKLMKVMTTGVGLIGTVQLIRKSESTWDYLVAFANLFSVCKLDCISESIVSYFWRSAKKLYKETYGFKPAQGQYELFMSSLGVPREQMPKSGFENIAYTMAEEKKFSGKMLIGSLIAGFATIIGFPTSAISKYVAQTTIGGCLVSGLSNLSSFILDKVSGFFSWVFTYGGGNNAFVLWAQERKDFGKKIKEYLIKAPEWIDRSNKLEQEFIAFPQSANQLEKMNELITFINEGKSIHSTLISVIDSDFKIGAMAALISKRLHKFEEIYVLAKKNHEAASKIEPVVILVAGPAGLGKSRFTNALAVTLLANSGITAPTEIKGSIFSFNEALDHCDGYTGQEIVIVDDLFKDVYDPASQTKYRTVNMLLGVASPYEHTMKMAALEQKGIKFTSKYIIMTTNYAFPEIPFCMEAFWRRIDQFILCSFPGGKNVSADMSEADYQPDFSHLNLRRFQVDGRINGVIYDLHAGLYLKPFSQKRDHPINEDEWVALLTDISTKKEKILDAEVTQTAKKKYSTALFEFGNNKISKMPESAILTNVRADREKSKIPLSPCGYATGWRDFVRVSPREVVEEAQRRLAEKQRATISASNVIDSAPPQFPLRMMLPKEDSTTPGQNFDIMTQSKKSGLKEFWKGFVQFGKNTVYKALGKEENPFESESDSGGEGPPPETPGPSGVVPPVKPPKADKIPVTYKKHQFFPKKHTLPLNKIGSAEGTDTIVFHLGKIKFTIWGTGKITYCTDEKGRFFFISPTASFYDQPLFKIRLESKNAYEEDHIVNLRYSKTFEYTFPASSMSGIATNCVVLETDEAEDLCFINVQFSVTVQDHTERTVYSIYAKSVPRGDDNGPEYSFVDGQLKFFYRLKDDAPYLTQLDKQNMICTFPGCKIPTCFAFSDDVLGSQVTDVKFQNCCLDHLSETEERGANLPCCICHTSVDYVVNCCNTSVCVACMIDKKFCCPMCKVAFRPCKRFFAEFQESVAAMQLQLKNVEKPVVVNYYALSPENKAKERRRMEHYNQHFWYRMSERFPYMGKLGKSLKEWVYTSEKWTCEELTYSDTGSVIKSQLYVDGVVVAEGKFLFGSDLSSIIINGVESKYKNVNTSISFKCDDESRKVGHFNCDIKLIDKTQRHLIKSFVCHAKAELTSICGGKANPHGSASSSFCLKSACSCKKWNKIAWRIDDFADRCAYLSGDDDFQTIMKVAVVTLVGSLLATFLSVFVYTLLAWLFSFISPSKETAKEKPKKQKASAKVNIMNSQWADQLDGLDLDADFELADVFPQTTSVPVKRTTESDHEGRSSKRAAAKKRNKKEKKTKKKSRELKSDEESQYEDDSTDEEVRERFKNGLRITPALESALESFHGNKNTRDTTINQLAGISQNFCRVVWIANDKSSKMTMVGMYVDAVTIVVPYHLFEGTSFDKYTLMVQRFNATSAKMFKLTDKDVLRPKDLPKGDYNSWFDKDKCDIAFVTLEASSGVKSIAKHIHTGAVDNSQYGKCFTAYYSSYGEALDGKFTIGIKEVSIIENKEQNYTGKTVTFRTKVYKVHGEVFAGGDCGTPLFALQNGTPKICGFLVAGTMTSSLFQPICVELLNAYYEKKEETGIALGCLGFGDLPNVEPGVVAQETVRHNILRYVGDLVDATPAIKHCGKTQFKQSYISKQLDIEITKKPAILSTAAVNKAMAKRDVQFGVFNPVVTKKAEQMMYEILCAAGIKPCETVSMEDALASFAMDESNYMNKGLTMDTSPGLPWIFTRPDNESGKKYLFNIDDSTPIRKYIPKKELRESVLAHIKTWDEGEANPCLFLGQLKDEKRDIERVKAEKTRLFMCSPVQKTIADRMLYLQFLNQYVDAQFEHAIGIDINSAEFHLLVEKHLHCSKGNHICLDGSGFDSRLNTEGLQVIARVIARFFKKARDKRRVSCSMQEAFHCFLVILGKVYLTEQGNPSGWLLTVVINNLYNLFLSLCAYILFMLEQKRPDLIVTATYLKMVVSTFLGDDMWKTIHQTLRQMGFNCSTLIRFYNIMGMKLTYPDKSDINAGVEYFRLDQVEFLKCRVVSGVMKGVSSAIYTAQLEKDSIEQSLHWMHKYCTIDEFLNTIRNALYQASMHGPVYQAELFDKIYKASCASGLKNVFQQAGICLDTINESVISKYSPK